jgi:hypothetical protein
MTYGNEQCDHNQVFELPGQAFGLSHLLPGTKYLVQAASFMARGLEIWLRVAFIRSPIFLGGLLMQPRS